MPPDPFPVLWAGEIAIVRLPGEIDVTNATAALTALTAALDDGAKVVIADMSGTKFCDSAGLASLVRAHQQAVANQARFRLVTMAPAVRRILTLTGVDTRVPVFDSVRAARSDSAG
jgi:anti-sigma B factor antagonist